MEDKIIIKSERYNVKKIFKFTLCIGVIIYLILSIIFSECYGSTYFFDLDGGFLFEGYGFWGFVFYSFVVPQVFAAIIYFWLKSYELNITEKRAYGTAAFGKRVDLPVDSITAISLGWLKSIKITTPSGRISFKLIKNRDKMYKAISDLIVERQSKFKAQETIVKQEIHNSNADELKKYKELLDSGVITQNEFDAKKKQLLGL